MKKSEKQFTAGVLQSAAVNVRRRIAASHDVPLDDLPSAWEITKAVRAVKAVAMLVAQRKIPGNARNAIADFICVRAKAAL